MPVLIHFYDKPALYRYSSILHRYVYTNIYTYLCTYIYFPEGMFMYFFSTSTCKNKEYLRSFLICLWSGMAKRFKWSFWYVMVHDVPQDLLKGQHLALRSAVKLVTGLDEWTSSRSKICSKSLWPSSKCRKPCQYKKQIIWWLFFPSCRADVWASYAPNLGKAHQSFFLFGSWAWRISFSISVLQKLSHLLAKHTLRSRGQPKKFEVAPIKKAVSFRLQTSVYGIKYSIARFYQHRPPK